MRLSLSIEFKWRDEPQPEPQPEAGLDLDSTVFHHPAEVAGEVQRPPVGFGRCTT